LDICISHSQTASCKCLFFFCVCVCVYNVHPSIVVWKKKTQHVVVVSLIHALVGFISHIKIESNHYSCGRVSCEREGYDFCNFCGYQVQPPSTDRGDGSNVLQQHDAAWIHKEKLLRYDRESAQRTRVLDDQADYFSVADDRFLSQHERDEAREKEEERNRTMHQRQKMQLNLAL
jgi:hypothetical protein